MSDFKAKMHQIRITALPLAGFKGDKGEGRGRERGMEGKFRGQGEGKGKG